jgi:hypothetical protein
MGSPSPLILKVSTPEYKKVVVEASDGKRYYADLSPLEKVYCFPLSKQEWDQVAPDSFGSALIWSSRFETHIDQVIGFAYKSETIAKTA